MAKNHSSEKARAVLYLRVSSDEQTESIPAQRAELTKYAKAKGYKIVREYVDEAISGDATERRVAFLEMRDDCDSGKFDLILSWDQDRFGRFDPLDAGYWIYPFRQAGVRLETVAQGEIDWEDLPGQLIYSMNQMGKAQFLRDLSRNTTRGLLASAREGRAGTGGPNPYGYRSKDGEVTIVPEEAKVVRLIFREYLKPSGSIRSVVIELNRRKIKPPRGGTAWRMSSVRAILERQKYTGTFVYGAKNAGKYHSWRDGEIIPRRKSDKILAADPIIHENKFDAIISQETFDHAQAKLQANKGKTSPRKARQYLLAGLVKCGDCDGAMGGLSPKSRALYRCRLYHQSGCSACYCNTIDEAPLVAVIVRKIQQKYLSSSALARLRKALEKEQESRRPRPEDLTRLRKEIEKLDQKIDQGAERVLDAPPDVVPILCRKLEELKVERGHVKRELERQTQHGSRVTGQDHAQIDRALDSLRELGKALEDAQPEETKQLLASIVSKVVLHYDHEKTEGGRVTSAFREGIIYLRPITGEGSLGEPKSTHLINNRPICGTHVKCLQHHHNPASTGDALGGSSGA